MTEIRQKNLSDKGNTLESAHPLLLKACRREPVERTPVWLMRQAGRFMPEYRKIRESVPFLDLCHNPELSAEVTVMAVEQLGVDAGIIFADILLPLEPMGVGLEFVKGDGPHIQRPVRRPEDVENLLDFDVEAELGFVCQAIKTTVAALKPDIPLIGFAGAPFTLASYMIEGGSSRHFETTKKFMYQNGEAWKNLMVRLSDITSQYLKAQIRAGARVVQLFDSWVGCLSPHDYRKYVLPYSQRTISGVEGAAPVIHFGTGTGALLQLMKEAGGDVIGLDWRVELDAASDWLGGDVAVMGNLDPVVLLAGKDEIKEQTARIVKQAAGRKGHIFNLGHGILPSTPVENVKYLVEQVRELSSKVK